MNKESIFYCETYNENLTIKDAKTCDHYRKGGDVCKSQSSRTRECTVVREFKPKYIPR